MNTRKVPQGYVLLKSSDGFEFYIAEECAKVSKFLKTTLESGFSEAKTGQLNLNEIPGHLLEKVCEYFYYHIMYEQTEGNLAPFEFPPEMAVELLMVANFLDT
ncbi:hypothetical protein GpartN1_g6695.t1 [Galdieria partita]|uniref:Elongin-C n=1 Tax=Galdieria partita TaxID=83374 RepID=A0A9C7UT63_9RHOD|nr:hypothetical protein GpartN1_g6695.t1 [Galdieria partita]